MRRQTDVNRQQWLNEWGRVVEFRDVLMPKLSTHERKAMPARQFAFPSHRKEPLGSASHVRNAIARFSHVQGVSDDERDDAWRRIVAAVALHGVELREEDWRELLTTPARTRSGRGRPGEVKGRGP